MIKIQTKAHHNWTWGTEYCQTLGGIDTEKSTFQYEFFSDFFANCEVFWMKKTWSKQQIWSKP